MKRRTVLTRGMSAGFATVGMAGCSGGDNDSADSGGDSTTPNSGGDSSPSTGSPGTGDTTSLSREGFEKADMSLWSIEQSDWGRSAKYAYEGDYSAGIERGDSGATLFGTLATARPANLDGGSRVDGFSYYWLELESSFGGGIRLVNSRGDVEIGVATDNPNWMIDDVRGPIEVYAGDGYRRWVRTDLSFNWAEGSVDIEFNDMKSGQSYSENHDLKQGNNIETIQIRGFTSSRGWETRSCHMYWDELHLQ